MWMNDENRLREIYEAIPMASPDVYLRGSIFGFILAMVLLFVATGQSGTTATLIIIVAAFIAILSAYEGKLWSWQFHRRFIRRARSSGFSNDQAERFLDLLDEDESD